MIAWLLELLLPKHPCPDPECGDNEDAHGRLT